LATTPPGATRNTTPGSVFEANPGGPPRRVPDGGRASIREVRSRLARRWRRLCLQPQVLEDLLDRRAFEDCALIFSSP
jgi:hypothetical protein